ncbi:MAG TPA: ABC transporter substrate-binding protein [Streptosporangiaceae bacterium]|nr:ABC transporter substrate-binding protein [Streptosporangiaceae bacterium]
MPLALATSVALVASCASTGSGGSSSNATFTTIGYTTVITPGAPMNPFNATNNVFPTFDAMQLGWNAGNSANPNQELPGLAKSWSLSPDGTSLTVHLQPGAKWSNGKPVTATDVKDSAAIWFAQGTAQTYNLGGVTVDNPSTVTFTEAQGAHNNLFETVLGEGSGAATQWIVPSFEYGSLLPADIWSTIQASEGTGKAATTASTSLTSLAKKIDAYAPKTDISAGPFAIKRLNNSEALLVRNPHFYAAGKVHVGQVIMEHQSGAQQIYSYLEGGKLDAAPYTAMATNVYKQVLAAGNTPVKMPSLVASALTFDEKTAPYNNVKVRQALAYVIDRSAVQKVGEPTSGTPSTTITGAVSAALPDYLTPAQQAALNPYKPSTAKATALLKSAGLTLKGGKWYLPGGKPWTITLPVPQGFADWLSASSVIKSELTSFGIPTKITGGPAWTEYQPNLFKGQYPVGWWLIALGPGAYATFSRIYGTYDGYVPAGTTAKRYPAGNAAADNFLNTPDTVTVPGAGTVNPGQLTFQLSQVNLGSPAGLAQQKAISAKIIQAANYEVPVIQLWDYIDVQFVNTKRFTDFPKSDEIVGQDPGLWMTDGYVRAK